MTSKQHATRNTQQGNLSAKNFAQIKLRQQADCDYAQTYSPTKQRRLIKHAVKDLLNIFSCCSPRVACCVLHVAFFNKGGGFKR